MLSLFFIGIAFIALVVAILIQQGKVKKSSSDLTATNVRTEKLKNTVQLVVDAPLPFCLVIEKSAWWKRMLSGSILFPQPQTCDPDFDRLFSITAYREDVVTALRNAASLKKSLIGLASETPSFFSLSMGRDKLTLHLTGRLSDEKLEPIRSAFASMSPTFLKPFAELAPDNASETLARRLDYWAAIFPVFSMITLIATGFINDQILVSSAFPWRQILLVTGIFVLSHWLFLFAITTQGLPRKRGMIAVAWFAFLFSYSGALPLVRYIDTLSQDNVTAETVTVAKLYQYYPRKGRPSFYIYLTGAPSRLAFNYVGANVALEINRALYDKLASQSLQFGSKLEIEESCGLLGLPYVLDAKPQ